MNTLKLLLVALVAAVAGAIAFAYFGTYNVAADSPHWPITARLMAAARDRSVALRARDVVEPTGLDGGLLIPMGAEHYSQMCTGCHLAPGLLETEIRAGLYPKPPDLTKRGTPRTPQQTFWIIKHGLKMTGMPAWGATHDDRSIWAMVAFLQKLPELSAAEYKALVDKRQGAAHSHADSGEHPHPETQVPAEGEEHHHQ